MKASQTINLKIDGRVSLGDLRIAIAAFEDLLRAISLEAGASESTNWIVGNLKGGSAEIGAVPLIEMDAPDAWVDSAYERYGEIAEAAKKGSLDRFPPTIAEPLLEILDLISDPIPSIHMGYGDQDWSIETRPIDLLEQAEESPPISVRKKTRSAVKGRIVTLDDKRGVFFALEEAYTRRIVRCWTDKSYAQQLADCWAAEKWVIVEGTYARFSTRPTLTLITRIVELENAVAGDWKKAVGCLAPLTDIAPRVIDEDCGAE